MSPAWGSRAWPVAAGHGGDTDPGGCQRGERRSASPQRHGEAGASTALERQVGRARPAAAACGRRGAPARAAEQRLFGGLRRCGAPPPRLSGLTPCPPTIVRCPPRCATCQAARREHLLRARRLTRTEWQRQRRGSDSLVSSPDSRSLSGGEISPLSGSAPLQQRLGPTMPFAARRAALRRGRGVRP
jgi:hypothetical protein